MPVPTGTRDQKGVKGLHAANPPEEDEGRINNLAGKLRSNRVAGLLGPAALLTAASLWGGSYSVNKVALEVVHPLFLIAAHNLVAVTAMAPWAARDAFRTGLRPLLGAAGMGLLTFAAAVCLLGGLTGTSPGLAAFIIVQLSIVTPLLAALFSQGAITRRLGLAILFVVAGMVFVFLLGERTAYSRATLLVPIATLLLSFHMLALDKLTHRMKALVLVWVQAGVTAGLALTLTLALGHWPSIPWELPGRVFLAAFYGGLAGSFGAYLLQTLGQRRTPVTHAGIFISLESVIALVISVLAGLESLGPRRFLGFALILTGTVIAQLDAGRLQAEAQEHRAELGPPI
ncbi:MAG: DMT family transporter [Thermoleophilia bacterium]